MHDTSLEMNVSCSQCATRYAIPDEKVRGRKYRLPCRRCGHAIIIDARELPPTPTRRDARSSSRVSRAGGTSVRGGKPPWSVSVDGAVREMSVSQLAAGYQQGRIPPHAYVWRSGLSGWMRLHEADELLETMASIGVDVSELRALRGASQVDAKGLADSTAGLDSDATQVTGPPSSSLPLSTSDAALADAVPDDDEATVMFSPPAPALSDALPDDEDEATALFSPSAHRAAGKGKPEAVAPGRARATAPSGSDGNRAAPQVTGSGELSDALPDDEDEATALYSPSAHGPTPARDRGGHVERSAPEVGGALGQTGPHRAPGGGGQLADALGEDDEATRLLDVDKRVRDPRRVGKSVPEAPVAPSGRDPISSRPPARAESAAPVVPPRATDSASDWSESSVVLDAEAPDENLARVPDRIGLEQADERTDKTKAGRRKRSGTGPIVTVVLVIVLVVAAGTAGYLLSQRDAPRDQGSAGAVGRDPHSAGASEQGVAEPPNADDDRLGPQGERAGTPAGAGSEPGDAPQTAFIENERPERAVVRRPVAEGRAELRGTRMPGRVETPTSRAADPPLEGAEDDDTSATPEGSAALEPFDRAEAKAAVLAGARAAETQCSRPGEPNGSSIVSLTLATTGKAVGVSVRGPLSGTTTALCIMKKFSKVSVAPFSGDPVPMQHTVRIP